MQSLRCTKRLLLALALCLTFNGCVIGAAVDLTAMIVLTAGKLVVRRTGAAIDAAIPDGKRDKDRGKERNREKPESEEIVYKEKPSDEVTQ